MSGSAPHVVAVLVRHGVMPLELGAVHQVFRQAVGSDGLPLYDVLTCAVEPGVIRTDADVTITVEHGPDVLARADTVVVPAAHEDDATMTDGTLPAPLAAALGRIRPGTRIASVCTGAFVLAAAGMLDGRRATTHWKLTDRFRALYPRVDLDPDVLYVDGGDDILTAAGEAAGIDLCLHMVRCDHGAAVAAAVARSTVVPPHREGGQAQFVRRPLTPQDGASTGAARAWAAAHLDRTIDLDEMARRSAMSVRTFTRRFRAETGVSPTQWLLARRLDLARELLEDTDLSIERVARDAGFGSPVSLRQHLREQFGVTPRAYRATFRGPDAVA